ncbi:hypothetical protein FJZ31_37000 [Candidatus Poribacteria bacterium]|nr:hypothetical protein [Candidatus Poribacteria bacterium]
MKKPKVLISIQTFSFPKRKSLIKKKRKGNFSIIILKRFFAISCIIMAMMIHSSESAGSDWMRPRFFEGKLSLSNAPTLGEKATLLLELTPVAGDSQDTTILFRLPDGIVHLSNLQFQKQQLNRNSLYRYSVEIRIAEEDNYILQASVYYRLSNGKEAVQHFFTYLSVTKTGSHLSAVPFPVIKLRPLYSEALPHEVPLAPPAVVDDTVRIDGKIKYYDDNIRSEVPIKGVKVTLFEKNISLSDTEIAATYTDAWGVYSFSGIDNIDPEDSTGRDLYIILSFQNDALIITNKDDALYQFASPSLFDVSDGSVFINHFLNSGHPQRAIGQIFNVIMDEYNYLLEHVGWSRKQMQVKYPFGTWAAYSPGFPGSKEYIQIPTEFQWERGAILHEYGHAMMKAAYGDDANNLPKTAFGGSPHYIFSAFDAGFAMIEGWAEFMEALVDDNAFNVTGYSNRNTPNIEYNDWWTGDIDGRGNNRRGEIVEGAVASILWDISDTSLSQDEKPNVDDDGLNGLFPMLWNIMVKHQPQNIIDIWNHWNLEGYGYIDQLRGIYADHGVVPPTVTKPPAGGILISIPNIIGWPNEKDIVVSISVSNAKGIANGDITLTYDSGILIATDVKKTDLTADFALSSNINLADKVFMSLTSAAGITEESGVLVEVVFNVKPDVEPGKSSKLALESVSLYDKSGAAIAVVTNNGNLTVEGLAGDINKDAEVTSEDAILALSIAVDLIKPDAYQQAVGDMDKNGEINSADAILILRKAAGVLGDLRKL